MHEILQNQVYSLLLLIYSQATTSSTYFSWYAHTSLPYVKRRGPFTDTLLRVLTRLSWLNTTALWILAGFVVLITLARNLTGDAVDVPLGGLTTTVRMAIFLLLAICLWVCPYATYLASRAMLQDQRDDGKTDEQVRRES